MKMKLKGDNFKVEFGSAIGFMGDAEDPEDKVRLEAMGLEFVMMLHAEFEYPGKAVRYVQYIPLADVMGEWAERAVYEGLVGSIDRRELVAIAEQLESMVAAVKNTIGRIDRHRAAADILREWEQ